MTEQSPAAGPRREKRREGRVGREKLRVEGRGGERRGGEGRGEERRLGAHLEAPCIGMATQLHTHLLLFEERLVGVQSKPGEMVRRGNGSRFTPRRREIGRKGEKKKTEHSACPWPRKVTKVITANAQSHM